MDYSEEDLHKAEKQMRELEELAKKPHSLTYQEANQIVSDLGRVILFLTESNLFPLDMPNSLLPREKQIVLEAFAVCFKHSKPDTQDRDTLYKGFFMVNEEFTEDKNALKSNHKLISSPTYWEKISRKK